MLTQKRHPILVWSILGTVDGAGFAVAYAFTMYVTCPAHIQYYAHAVAGMPLFLAALALWYVVAFRHRLFLTRRGELLLTQLVTITRVLFVWLILTVFVAAMIAPNRLDRTELLIFTPLSIVLVLLGRSFLRFSVWDLRRRGYNSHRIVIVGASQCTDHLVRTIQANEQFGWHIEGFLDDDPASRPALERYGVAYLGKIADLDQLLVQRVVDGVFVNLPLQSSYALVQDIVNLCEGVGVPVRMVADFFALRIGWTDVRRIADLPVVSLVSRPSTHFRVAAKRSAEWLIASALLLLFAPVFLLVAIAIRTTSSGPVFVRQQRLSRNRRPFQMFVFRTTFVSRQDHAIGVTPVGTFLRRYGLDELPQLINIWRGEMALIGARPLNPSTEYPCVGCPRCWPEREPGMVRLWKQRGDEPTQPQCAAAMPNPNTTPADAPDEVHVVGATPSLEGTE